MSAHNTTKVTLSIPNGQSNSPFLSSILSAGQMKAVLGSAVQMVVFVPAALTAAVTMEVVATEGDSSNTRTLQQSTGTDVPFAAGKAVQINAGAFKDFRFHSAGAEAAQRDFDIVFQLTVTE